MLLTDCGNGGDDFTELELVEDSGLSGGIETNHEDSHLLLAPQAVEQLGEGKTHVGGGLWRVLSGVVEEKGIRSRVLYSAGDSVSKSACRIAYRDSTCASSYRVASWVNAAA
jgi:hypothetical protein